MADRNGQEERGQRIRGIKTGELHDSSVEDGRSCSLSHLYLENPGALSPDLSKRHYKSECALSD